MAINFIFCKEKKVFYQLTELTDKHTMAARLLKLMIQVRRITKSEPIHVITRKNEKGGNQHLFYLVYSKIIF